MHSNQNDSDTQAAIIKVPMRKIYQLSISAFVLLLLSVLILSCSNKKKGIDESTSLNAIKTSELTNEATASIQNYEIVPNEKVCMVNDRFMGVPQIAIDVNGVTYYGCCDNCVEKLQKNLDDVRFGTNPLNKIKVDKALAIIVQDKSKGSVYYFSSKEEANTFINKLGV